MKPSTVKTASPTKNSTVMLTGTVNCQACRSAANVYRTSKQAGFINCPECGFSQPLVGYCFGCN